MPVYLGEKPTGLQFFTHPLCPLALHLVRSSVPGSQTPGHPPHIVLPANSHHSFYTLAQLCDFNLCVSKITNKRSESDSEHAQTMKEGSGSENHPSDVEAFSCTHVPDACHFPISLSLLNTVAPLSKMLLVQRHRNILKNQSS